MTRTLSSPVAAAAAALFLLSGCQQAEPEVIETPDPMAGQLANAAPVELPPSIRASRTYRCRDNSLAYVTFYSNNTADFRTDPDGDPTRLTAESEDAAYTAEGISVSGSGDEVTIARPGAESQSCHV